VRFAPHARFWQASSSEIFERGVQKISAQAPRRAGSPYGQTKIQADAWVGFFRDTYNLDAASVIAFNHESPLRPLGFVWKVIQSQFEQNKEGPLTVRLNNPNSAKDWGWAPDYMDALLKTRKLASATDLVLASGRLTPLGEVVQQFAHKYNVQTFDIIETGSERQNDSEHPFGDISKTTELIDWAPTTSLSEAVSFMVDYSDLNATEGERLSIHREWIASLMAKAGEVS
jgi:GDPmannose 4,6-dehydratase